MVGKENADGFAAWLLAGAAGFAKKSPPPEAGVPEFCSADELAGAEPEAAEGKENAGFEVDSAALSSFLGAAQLKAGVLAEDV